MSSKTKVCVESPNKFWFSSQEKFFRNKIAIKQDDLWTVWKSEMRSQKEPLRVEQKGIQDGKVCFLGNAYSVNLEIKNLMIKCTLGLWYL